jgi:hypothetical protein
MLLLNGMISSNGIRPVEVNAKPNTAPLVVIRKAVTFPCWSTSEMPSLLQVALPIRPGPAAELCTMECSRSVLRPGKDGGGT